jgi:hypothetical protein
MATTATPYGAEPVNTLSASGSFTGKVNHIPIATTYGTAIFYGDFVDLAVGGTIQKTGGTATLAAGLIGIFMGCAYTDPTTGQFTCSQQWPASNAATDAVAYVLDDPNVIFMMQATGALTQAWLQGNSAITETAGSTKIGKSKNALTRSTTTLTATLPIRIVGFVDGPLSTVGDAYTDVLCKFNGYHLNFSNYSATIGTGLATS